MRDNSSTALVPTVTRAALGSSARLDPELTSALREQLRAVAVHTIAAVMAEVPEYAGALSGRMGANVENAVQMALAGFLRLASRGRRVDASTPLSPALEGAYALGRGEARDGRSADALLAAYRVGARVAWRELSATAVQNGASAESLASFAELVFAYIDELSAASVAGHADELASSTRQRERDLRQLALALVAGEPADALLAAAARAEWAPPVTLTAILLPEAQVRPVLTQLDPRTLAAVVERDADAEALAVLLVPDLPPAGRAALVRTLAGRHAVLGPTRPWLRVHASYARARRAVDPTGRVDVLDTEQHLVPLVLAADPEALDDLRARTLAPLDGLRPATAEKLRDTLRAWLLHHGRRDEVAAALFVHPQTVRYRMGQLRERFGDRLDDPDTVLELTLALALPSR
ncbi:MAG: helix-turn-helix domain-containing protein [Nocardioides sp.]